MAVPTRSIRSAKVTTKGVPSASGRTPIPTSQVSEPPASQRQAIALRRSATLVAAANNEIAAVVAAMTPATAPTTTAEAPLTNAATSPTAPMPAAAVSGTRGSRQRINVVCPSVSIRLAAAASLIRCARVAVADASSSASATPHGQCVPFRRSEW